MSAQLIFATLYDDHETYKTHEETVLTEGLKRTVCYHIKA
jgi:hypothetical protein